MAFEARSQRAPLPALIVDPFQSRRRRLVQYRTDVGIDDEQVGVAPSLMASRNG
ncbi:MAG: hypothetical protein R2710_04345 [Acidimicrobiales bacterium]